MENVINDISMNTLLKRAFENENGNKYHEAISLYEAAILQNQESYWAYMNLGALYEKIDNESKALNTYKKGIEVARLYNNKKIEKEFSYTLLGLMD